MIAADAAGGDDDGLRTQAEVADRFARTAPPLRHQIRFEDRAVDALDGAVMNRERLDKVAEFEGQPSRFFRAPGAGLERLDDAGTRAPGDVEPGHRIAVAHGVVAAALGPADHRKNTVAHRPQPTPLLGGGESQIGLRPAPRPEVLVAIEPRRAHPVLMRQIVTVLDA